MIKTDYHCHALPQFDDGSESVEMTLKMLATMKEQGIENIIFTPHFYPHREKSVRRFIERREESFRKIKDENFNFYLGAEVAVERGIGENPDISSLAIQGTNLILLELPFSNVGRWAIDEIHNLSCETGLRPIIAHVHRYTDIFSKDDFEAILNLDAIMQINVELFRSFLGRLFFNKIVRSGAEIIFGSDAHNMTDRKPDYSPLRKHVKDETIFLDSDSVLEKYKK